MQAGTVRRETGVMDRVTTARATTALGTMIAAMMIVDPTIAANAHHQKKMKALGRLSLPSAFFRYRRDS
ncbi:protein of unknown function [Hyphomicrobium sp. MC1]|nr:protein of unknown function [Hyphomicrobium sp. MC1]